MPRNNTGTRAVCLPVEQWPETDATAWRIAFEPATDPFSEYSPACSWSPRSRIKTEHGYGRWLYWVSEAGENMTLHPADRVNPEQVRRYVADLRRFNSDFTVLCRMQELYDAIRVIVPDRDWSWLRRAHNRLRSRCVPVRDKTTRIQPTEALVELGRRLMTAAEAAKSTPALSRALLFRDGLMIAFLAYRFLRLSNFAMITLGLHLIRHSDGYRLCFSGPEMKGRRPFEAMIPAGLVAAFDRYLDHYRSILLTRGGLQPPAETDRLWVSEIATALHESSIPQRIKKHTRAAFGKHLWPHLFRDCAATTVAIEGPEHVGIVPNLLAQSGPRIYEKHYNQARGLEAHRRYQRLLDALLESDDEGDEVED
jgi:hypothetical protein